MQSTNRREFFRAAGLAAAGAVAGGPSWAAARKMKMCLNTGNIGVKANLMESIAMAAKFGFEAVDPNVNELAALSDSAMSDLLGNLQSQKLQFGSVAQSVPVNQPDDRFAAFIKQLDATAKTLKRAHTTRFLTWLSSSDNNLTYLQNFKIHTKRIGEVAAVLGDNGVSLGLEYVGPKTGWTRGKYPFIHTMATMRELIAEIGRRNVGLLLDIWHWYNAGDTVADILALKNEDVVAVHMSDAPAGIPVDQQVDSRRALPCSTGVIDTKGFLNALNQIGYDGPAAAEPMSQELRSLPRRGSPAQVAAAMKKAFALIDVDPKAPFRLRGCREITAQSAAATAPLRSRLVKSLASRDRKGAVRETLGGRKRLPHKDERSFGGEALVNKTTRRELIRGAGAALAILPAAAQRGPAAAAEQSPLTLWFRAPAKIWDRSPAGGQRDSGRHGFRRRGERAHSAQRTQPVVRASGGGRQSGSARGDRADAQAAARGQVCRGQRSRRAHGIRRNASARGGRRIRRWATCCSISGRPRAAEDYRRELNLDTGIARTGVPRRRRRGSRARCSSSASRPGDRDADRRRTNPAACRSGRSSSAKPTPKWRARRPNRL